MVNSKMAHPTVDAQAAQVAPAVNEPEPARPRRGSFSFLRRSKSRESTSSRRPPTAAPTEPLPTSRKLSRRGKKNKPSKDDPPELPPQISKATLPQINASFGNGIPHTSAAPSPAPTDFTYTTTTTASYRPSSASSRTGYDPNAFYRKHLMAERKGAAADATPPPPVPPLPASPTASNIESMANRGRYSYASSVTSHGPAGARKIRRRKDPTPFNVLVIGTPHSGKSSFIDFVCHALTRPARQRQPASPQPETVLKKGHPFSSHYVEADLEGERVGLTMWDSASLEKHIIDIQLREITNFIEGKFQETFTEESKVLRSTNVRDTHIHCVLFVMDPQQLDLNLAAAGPNARSAHYPGKPVNIAGALDTDYEGTILRGLQGMTTVIPVVSKADTITTAHMSQLKRLVWDSFKKLKVDPLEVLNIDSDDEGSAYETALSDGGDDEDDTAESEYDNAEENLDDAKKAEEDGDKTPVKAKFSQSKGGLAAPKHDEVRVSAMSMNVDLPQLPLSILSPDTYEPGVIGRRFPWGFADPYNTDHCDFVKLTDNVFNEWRAELRTVARERWYENWRTTRLKSRSPTPAARAFPTRTAAHHTAQNAQNQRAVSSAAAYGGKSPEARMARNPSAQHVPNGSASHPPVSASDIGVAVSNGVDSPKSPQGPQSPQSPDEDEAPTPTPAPKPQRSASKKD